MFLVRFKCPECGAAFRKLRMFVSSDSTRRCPRCKTDGVPPVKEDLETLKLQERCSSFG